jgi:hypothetical protein
MTIHENIFDMLWTKLFEPQSWALQKFDVYYKKAVMEV